MILMDLAGWLAQGFGRRICRPAAEGDGFEWGSYKEHCSKIQAWMLEDRCLENGGQARKAWPDAWMLKLSDLIL